MSATAYHSTSTTWSPVVVRDAELHLVTIGELAVCAVPAVGALFIGHMLLGARYLALSLLIFLSYHFVFGQRLQYSALAVGALPLLSFFRDVFFYYSVVVFLAGALLLWAHGAWDEWRFIWRDMTWRWLVSLSLLYWWLSILYTKSYIANIRLLDYVFSITLIYLLASCRSWLSTALVAVGISGTCLAVGLLPYGDRLGAADLDSIHAGNPILIGVPSAMILLLALADNGRWLLLENRPWARAVLALASGQWLVLSGSRGSWAIFGVSISLLLIFGKLGRRAVVGCVILTALAATLVLLSHRGSFIQSVFDKTVDSDRSLKNRTSFRSVQWAAIPDVLAASPIWGWGPGSGKDVAFLYTGRHLAWHSLYLQILGETGLLGFVILLWILGSLLRRGILHLRRLGEIMPLLGVVAYMTMGMSVSGFDAMAGIFLGLAFISREHAPRFSLREASTEVPAGYEAVSTT